MFLRKLRHAMCVSVLLLSAPTFAVDETKIFQTLYNGPQLTYEAALQYTQVMAHAVYLASIQNGRIVTTGTLTQYAPDFNSFSYTAEPSDKLNIKFMNGFAMEYKILDLRGNFNGDGQNFLYRDHALSYNLVIPQTAEVNVQNQQLNGQRAGMMSGRIKFQDTEYEIDIRNSGTYYFENDNSGLEYKTSINLTGTFLDKTNSMSMNVSDTYSSNFILARDRSSGKSSSAMNTIIGKNSTLTHSQQVYRLDNVQIRKNFKDGKPHDSSYWHASGSVRANEQPVGIFRLGSTAEQTIDIVLELANKKTILLESFPIFK